MPKIRLLLKRPRTGWTKAPNALFDVLLPTLKDTELRVLLVILRQTTGWNRDDGAITLSYRTLMERTGRHSEAIANALHSLTARRLIHTRGNVVPPPLRSRRPNPSPTEEQQLNTKD